MNRSLLSIAQLSQPEIHSLLSSSKKFQDEDTRNQTLGGKTIGLLFYENSTRTRISFENAIRRLGATPLSLSVATSSVQKGETLQDSARNLAALGVHAFVIRHPDAEGIGDAVDVIEITDDLCCIMDGAVIQSV